MAKQAMNRPKGRIDNLTVNTKYFLIMKKVMLGAVALLLGGVTYAQNNESKVEQAGTNSQTTVNQIGKSNDASTYSNGNDNNIDIDQKNMGNKVRVESRKTGSVAGPANGNDVKVLQDGKNNYSSVAVWGGENNDVNIKQVGNENNTGAAHGSQFFGVPRTVQIEGTKNSVDLNQAGNFNDGTVAVMEGAYENRIDVDQIGNDNASSVEVMGMEAGKNLVDVRQKGTGNTSAVTQDNSQRGVVDVLQDGKDHMSTVSQSSTPWQLSDKNRATVRQYDNLQISTVIQSGVNNTATVIQKK